MQNSKLNYLIATFGEKLSVALKNDNFVGESSFKQCVDDKNQYLKDGINKLLQADPKNGKFIQSIIRWYIGGEFKLEDVYRVKDDLTFFNKIKSKLPNKDLLIFDTLKEVYDLIRPFQDNDSNTKSNKELMREAKSGAKKLFQEKGIIILEIETEEAAKLYGKGTRWCTAGDNNNMFEHYHKQGALYIIIADSPQGNTRKFQIHYESEQMMDEDDSSVSVDNQSEIILWLEKYDSYVKFCEMLLYKHNKELVDKYYELLHAGKINPDGTVREPTESVNA